MRTENIIIMNQTNMQWFFGLGLAAQIVLSYVVGITIVTFFYFGIDKMKSRFNSRRISEKALWILSLAGGSLGALLGMYFFRHKTRKLSFQAGLAIIMALQLLLAMFLILRF